MIQVYDRNNINYQANGDMTLQPTLCDFTIRLNGECEVEISHNIDDLGRWKYLTEENVIACPTPYSDKQLFRIYKKNKTFDGIMAYARPIFFDSARTMLIDTRPTQKPAQEALDIIFADTPFSAETDLKTVSTAYYIRKNIMEALAGDDENSFVNRWGGERLYDNYKVIVNERIGGDYGVTAEFGKNLLAIDEEIDMDEMVTRIVPTSYNGYMLEGNEPWVDSPNIDKYSLIYMKEIRFEHIKLTEDASEDDTETYDTLEELRAALIKACEKMFEDGADLPSLNCKVDMVELANTEEYKDYEMLETVSIGDTVRCRYSGLGVDIEGRCISLIYDCIREVNKEVELGNYTDTYLDRLGSVYNRVENAITPAGVIRGEYVEGVINGMKAQLKVQKNIAQKQEQRAILFEDIDPASPTFGAMCLGTQGFEIASKRTTDGKDWNWETYGTAQGFTANHIIAGILASQNYKEGQQGSLFNLNNGEIEMNGGQINLYASNLSTAKIKVSLTSDGNVYSYITPAYVGIRNNNSYISIVPGNLTIGSQSGNVGTGKGVFAFNSTATSVTALDGNDLNLDSASGRINAGSRTSLKPFYASEFVNSSRKSKKADIKPLVNAMDILKNTDIYTYTLKDEVKKGDKKRRIGAVIGAGYKCADEIKSIDGKGVNQYSMIAVLWKAVKQLINRVDKLEREVRESGNRK